jgi:hypothetical protein
VLHAETPRYAFVIHRLDIIYLNDTMKSEITYTPIGCYRPIKRLTSDLNSNNTYKKFMPEHIRIIVGIHTLECCLDLKNKEHAIIYMDFIKECSTLISSDK